MLFWPERSYVIFLGEMCVRAKRKSKATNRGKLLCHGPQVPLVISSLGHFSTWNLIIKWQNTPPRWWEGGSLANTLSGYLFGRQLVALAEWNIFSVLL